MLAWRPTWVLAPFLFMLTCTLFVDYEYGPLFMGAIVLALAAYAVSLLPLGIMVLTALTWEIVWRLVQDAVDGRLLWPTPIVLLLLLPGRTIRILVQRNQRERAAAHAQERAARQREAALVEENKLRRLAVSRELHDVVAHELTRIAMQASMGQLSTDPEEKGQALNAISSSARTAMSEMRRLVRLLHDGNEPASAVEPGAGVGALELDRELEQASAYLADLGFLPDWRLNGELERVPPGLLPTSVTVLREATTNTVKHCSPGARCHLSVDVDDDLVIDVRNEISDRVLDLPSSGAGLAGLRSRVTDLGGTFSYGRHDGWWVVRATMPISEST